MENFKARLETVIAVAVLLSMLIGVVLWGLKLDANIESMHKTVLVQESRLSRIEAENAKGMLPIAGERIASIREELVRLNAELNAFKEDHDRRFIPATHLQQDIEDLKSHVDQLEEDFRGRN